MLEISPQSLNASRRVSSSMLKDRLPTNTVTHPSSFLAGSRAAKIGLEEEYLIFSQRPPKSAPLCSIAAAAAAGSLKSIMAGY